MLISSKASQKVKHTITVKIDTASKYISLLHTKSSNLTGHVIVAELDNTEVMLGRVRPRPNNLGDYFKAAQGIYFWYRKKYYHQLTRNMSWWQRLWISWFKKSRLWFVNPKELPLIGPQTIGKKFVVYMEEA